MDDPMMSKYGQNFERRAILNWLAAGNESCPISAKPLRASGLITDRLLKVRIQSWKEENGEQAEDPVVDDIDYLTRSFLGLVLVPPKEFVCPITKEVMEDPVMTREGQSFERKAILKHVTKEGRCPLTGKRLLPSDLVTNGSLGKRISDWKVRHAPEIAANMYSMNTPRRNNLKAKAA